MPAPLIEFPADDPERACRFWNGVLGAELEPLRDGEVFPRLNHPTWRTIYPPGAQAFFQLVYRLRPDNVLAQALLTKAIAIDPNGSFAVACSSQRLPGSRLCRLR